ncbi:ankyrin repeat-containing domain protein [Aspergillus pseudocaelatus]|uniref:Ankyrin repeat-containing domain protein n=1 Tax=Aspergillus pseudocaelatus TaxID=1825620 RepID=A0ABQ6X2I9_9EURO|nr:ankyrin repeat-containing domain protein [Aspergillus pseudocaelatus]
MRLLHTKESHTGNLEILEFTDDRIPPYAILSHTWEGEEITFQDMPADAFHTKQKSGYDKVQRCCHLARTEGFDYVWIDSCCIDKTSSAELSEAINSMYRWYQEAEVCYAYLADVPSRKGFKESRWFTRGWTLQELIAPTKLIFLDENVAQRMSWAAERVTTRVEDRAYSLLGIFGVNIPLIYGERETAFIRLQEEIMRISDDHSLFACRSRDNRGGLLATSPAAFIGSHNIVRFNPFDPFNTPFAATSTGIDLRIRFMGIGPRGLGLAILHCKEEGGGERLIALYVRDSEFLTMERFERVHSEDFKQLDLRKYRPSQYPMRQMIIQAGRLASHRKSKDRGKCDSITPDIYPDATLMALMGFGEPSALLQAAERGLKDEVWLLLTRSDVEGIWRGPRGQTPLIYAAQHGHETVAKMLAARRDVIIDSKDDKGKTPLWWAAQAGHEATVKVLVEKSVDIDAKDTAGRTPLTIASANGHEGTVGILLDKGAAIEVQSPKFKQTPLLAAVRNGHEGIVRVLLEKAANIETQGLGHQASLLVAAGNGHEGIVRTLLEKGAIVDARDQEGRTPLLCAASGGHEAICRVLLESGAAAREGHLAIVKLLLQHGAEANIRDWNGNTPMAIANAKGRNGIVKLLRERLARHAYRNSL